MGSTVSWSVKWLNIVCRQNWHTLGVFHVCVKHIVTSIKPTATYCFVYGEEANQSYDGSLSLVIIYLLFIFCLLHAKHLDKSIKAQDRKEIQICKHITKNYTSSCQQNL